VEGEQVVRRVAWRCEAHAVHHSVQSAQCQRAAQRALIAARRAGDDRQQRRRHALARGAARRRRSRAHLREGKRQTPASATQDTAPHGSKNSRCRAIFWFTCRRQQLCQQALEAWPLLPKHLQPPQVVGTELGLSKPAGMRMPAFPQARKTTRRLAITRRDPPDAAAPAAKPNPEQTSTRDRAANDQTAGLKQGYRQQTLRSHRAEDSRHGRHERPRALRCALVGCACRALDHVGQARVVQHQLQQRRIVIPASPCHPPGQQLDFQRKAFRADGRA
jgi:hypothetical protein